MFVRINEFNLSTNTGNTPGNTMFAHAAIASSFTRTAEIDINVYDNRGPEPSVSLSGLELRPLAEKSSIKETQKDARNIYWEITLGLEVELLSMENFIPTRRLCEKSHPFKRKDYRFKLCYKTVHFMMAVRHPQQAINDMW
jgi:hypothetical protein